jgi:hypothetical protein
MPDYESWLLMTCALTLPAVTETTSDLTLVYHSSNPSSYQQQTSSTPYYVTAVATYPPSIASPRRVASFVYTTTYRGGQRQQQRQLEEGAVGQLYNVGVIRGGGEAGLEVRRQQQWLPQQQQQPLYMSSVPSVQSVQSVQQIRRVSPLSESSSIIPVNAGRPRLNFCFYPFLSFRGRI